VIDLGSFMNVAEADVMRDLQSALIGNHETVRKYGALITDTTLKQQLLNMGIAGGAEAATEQQKVLARLQMILDSTRLAYGDAERTQSSFSNQMKYAVGIGQDMAATFGQRLTAAISNAIERLGGMHTVMTLLEPAFEAVVSIGEELVPVFEGAARGALDWVRSFGGVEDVKAAIKTFVTETGSVVRGWISDFSAWAGGLIGTINRIKAAADDLLEVIQMVTGFEAEKYGGSIFSWENIKRSTLLGARGHDALSAKTYMEQTPKTLPDEPSSIMDWLTEWAGYAAGGVVRGYGAGDSVPAMLTPGEYVVNADSAARHRALLEAMNSGLDPIHMASGGSVGRYGGNSLDSVVGAMTAAIDNLTRDITNLVVSFGNAGRSIQVAVAALNSASASLASMASTVNQGAAALQSRQQQAIYYPQETASARTTRANWSRSGYNWSGRGYNYGGGAGKDMAEEYARGDLFEETGQYPAGTQIYIYPSTTMDVETQVLPALQRAARFGNSGYQRSSWPSRR
jgi:hypothetical protein